MSDNDNDPAANFEIIPRDPALNDVPCVFCGRTKRSNPEIEFAGNERHTVCQDDFERLGFLFNNADRPRLQDWFRTLSRSLREIHDGRDT